MTTADYGELIMESGLLNQYNEDYPLIHYISGIKEFDEALEGIPFCNTDFCHCMSMHKNAVVFYLYNNKTRIEVSYPKNDFVNVLVDKNITRIHIRQVNKVSKILKTGAAGQGMVGVLVTSAIGAVSDKITTSVRGIKSKEVDGNVFELVFKNKNDENFSVFVSSESEYSMMALRFLSTRILEEPVDTSSSSACYIASVCYGNPMAPQVIKFREFRDRILKRYYLGKIVVRLYYEYAEAFSNRLKDKPQFNKLIRMFILAPILLLIDRFFLSKNPLKHSK